MKKIFKILFPALLIFHFSCKNEKKEQNMFNPSKMVEIMTDIHIVEAILSDKQKNGIKTDSFANIYYSEIFTKYKISKKQLDENLNYYTSNPLEFGKIYDSIIEKLSKSQKDIKQ